MKVEPYQASEDSALLRGVLKEQSGQSCLEIGAGNGGNLAELTARFDLVAGTDISAPEMVDWKFKGANYVLADMANCFRDGVFDLVAFNPPYLPSEEFEDRTVDAGPDFEVPKRFLTEALRVVKRSGRVLMLLSDDTELGEFSDLASKSGFRLERVAGRRMFFEGLSAYEVLAG